MDVFESTFDPETRVLAHRARAPITTKAVAQCAVHWVERMQGQTFHALWDLRGQRLDIDVDELVFGLNDHIVWLHQHRQGQRHAYLVDSAAGVHLANALKRRIHLDWDVFSDAQLALDWVRTGDPAFRRPADPSKL